MAGRHARQLSGDPTTILRRALSLPTSAPRALIGSADQHAPKAGNRKSYVRDERTVATLSGINHKALEHAKFLLAQNSARLANADNISEIEREHHANVARIISR